MACTETILGKKVNSIQIYAKKYSFVNWKEGVNKEHISPHIFLARYMILRRNFNDTVVIKILHGYLKHQQYNKIGKY